MTKKTKRMVTDAILSILIVLAMFIQITGAVLHEIIGAVFFAILVAHLALSFKWMKGTSKQAKKRSLSKRNKALVVMAILLFVDAVVLAVSSVMISRILAGFGLASQLINSAWSDIHTISSYLLCVLTVVHLALHWSVIFGWAKIPYNPSRRAAIGKTVNVAAAFGMTLLVVNCAHALDLTPRQLRNGSSEEGAESNNSGSEDLDYQNLSVEDTPSNKETTNSSNSISGSSSSGSTSSSSSVSSGEKSSSSSASSSASARTSASSSTSSSATSQTCTLCKKRCPLSAPQCDKPNKAGLIS